MSRTIFIGDVHGCFHELKSLEKKLAIGDSDKVILLGDLINRGPYSAKTIQHVFKMGYQCVCGNHDLKYRWQYRQLNTNYHKIYKKIDKKAHEWYMHLPFYIEENDYIAVHAGLAPGFNLDKTDKLILTRIRTWDGRGDDLDNDNDPPWYHLYKGEKKVFYGHWALQELNIQKKTFGLDSGCVYGGELTAYILEEEKIVQVQALKVYCDY